MYLKKPTLIIPLLELAPSPLSLQLTKAGPLSATQREEIVKKRGSQSDCASLVAVEGLEVTPKKLPLILVPFIFI